MINYNKVNSEKMVNMKVVAGKTKLTVKQLNEIHPGSVLELDRNVDDLIDLYINDTLVAKGRLVTNKEELGINIVQIINKEDNN